ncbi:MAG: methyltransferase [Pseudomonadota bacterium]
MTSTADRLAETYAAALDLEKSGDHHAAARLYAQVLDLDPEDRTGAAVRLAAMGMADAPDKAPDAYVALLFDQTAERFDDILVDQLGYSVPLIVRDWLMKVAPGPYARMLDLGCGTGLSGEALADLTTHRTGVDLSENMLAEADDKGCYDDLYIGEAAAFLAAAGNGDPSHQTASETWDLIVATDLLPYIGELDDLFSGIARHMAPSGVFAFSNETQDDDVLAGRDFMVGGHHRFAHSERYVRARLRAHGMTVQVLAEIVVRYEQGQPVPGHLVLARHVVGGDKDASSDG